ncbi:MAG TPA: hypothetical protein VFF10_06015 [Trueperaceae bacterium]|nr:hypothetical protein [Trueperaceae bacterium]
MRGRQLLTGYVVRVAVKSNRWEITLIDLDRNETSTFDDFASLADHLERDAARKALSGREQPLQ